MTELEQLRQTLAEKDHVIAEKNAAVATLEANVVDVRNKAKAMFEKLKSEKDSAIQRAEQESQKCAKLENDLSFIREKTKEKIEQMREAIASKDQELEQLSLQLQTASVREYRMIFQPQD